ncbi:DUF3037 domain-containing protein [Tunturibacter empetritectus]|uniref:DUF3037 domain-containing protein n=2 Tax=Tunturiibacter empetritectus TaxID=3069691 RepID=A0A7W8MRR7_9BACT|nr:DUF3037 domain-containing protein [Edaphobacter lichenicola]MBB5317607.1 hypothetical protein [Edaphobacter lichenicola]
MAERVQCEFFLIRYVPDVVKGEFANIGVLLREAGRDDSAVVRFTRDWARVKCMDADADIGLLEALEGEIGARLRSGTSQTPGIKPVMEILEDTLANSVQMTEVRACLAESLPAEIEQLMKMYVEPLKVKAERKKTGRAAIAGAMRTEFERAGVWGLMRKRIAASLYTRAGDPMKIDCGYRAGSREATVGGVIRMLQAVSLEGDVEAAKGLAYSAPQLVEGVQRVEGAKLELTAIVEPLRAVSDTEDEAMERYRFGVEAMERQEIRVVTLSDLARVAETARVELRV